MNFSALSKLGHKPKNRMISHSQFDMYLTCPRRWELRYVKGHKEDEVYNIHFLLGSALGEIVQSYLQQMYEESAKAADNRNLSDELQTRMVELFNEEVKKSGSDSWTTPSEMQEYYEDGVAILDYFKKNRRKYFSKKTEVFLGQEIPLYSKVLDSHEVYYTGFIDFAIGFKNDNKVKLIDFKKSTRGWTDREKKSNKPEQLRVYKMLYALANNIHYNDIEVEFIILKQKLNEYNMYPQKRIQTWTPTSGKPTLAKTLNKVKSFVHDNFNTDGSFMDKRRVAVQGEKAYNCRYCPFKERHDLCPPEERQSTLE